MKTHICIYFHSCQLALAFICHFLCFSDVGAVSLHPGVSEPWTGTTLCIYKTHTGTTKHTAASKWYWCSGLCLQLRRWLWCGTGLWRVFDGAGVFRCPPEVSKHPAPVVGPSQLCVCDLQSASVKHLMPDMSAMWGRRQPQWPQGAGVEH